MTQCLKSVYGSSTFDPKARKGFRSSTMMHMKIIETTVVQPKISKLNTRLSSNKWSNDLFVVFDGVIDEIEDPGLVVVPVIRGYTVMYYFVIVLLRRSYEVPRLARFWGVS